MTAENAHTTETPEYAEELRPRGRSSRATLDSSEIRLDASRFDAGDDIDDTDETDWGSDGEDVFGQGDYELEERHALRRVAGLSTELADVTEVEYRQLRLERVVLVGVWTEGTVEDAD